jgi:hypothetical protein
MNDAQIKLNYSHFLANLSLILKLIITLDNELKVVEATNKLLLVLENKEIGMDKIGEIMKKIFSVCCNNLNLLENNDESLFYLKNNNRKITIISGIDIGQAYIKFNAESKILLWKYMKKIYIVSAKLIFQFNATIDQALMNYILKSEDINFDPVKEFREKYPDSNIISKEFNPYEGISNNVEGISMEDLIAKNIDNIDFDKIGSIGSMIEMIGLDKMINLEEISKQLQNIDKNEISKATEHIKSFIGDNIDKDTGNMIDMMLSGIAEKLGKTDLKNAKFDDVISMANNVGEELCNKIDPTKVDAVKFQNGTSNMLKNLINNCKDEKGNPILPAGFDPMAMVEKIMGMKQQTKTSDKQKKKKRKRKDNK